VRYERRQWKLTDVQRFVVLIACVVAFFLSAMALGAGRLTPFLVALLLVIGTGVGVFLLGLRYAGRGFTEGSAHVIRAQPRPVGMIVGRCDMEVVVDAPGLPATPMRHREHSVPVIKWPRPGMVLPIEIPPHSQRQFRVRWDLVAPHHVREVEPTPAERDTFIPDEFDVGTFDDALGLVAEPPAAFEPRTSPRPARPPIGLDPDDLLAREDLLAPGGRVAPALTAPELPLTQRPIPRPRAPGNDGPGQHGVGLMLFVADLERSLAFYRDLLDFTVVDSDPGSAVLSYGGGRVVLRRVLDMSPVDRRLVHLHLEVGDVDQAYRELRDKGVEFVHKPRVMSRGDRLELWAATFRDPDGHAIALTQWRARPDDR
jgi:resuscitation-promoting factor RpfA